MTEAEATALAYEIILNKLQDVLEDGEYLEYSPVVTRHDEVAVRAALEGLYLEIADMARDHDKDHNLVAS